MFVKTAAPLCKVQGNSIIWLFWMYRFLGVLVFFFTDSSNLVKRKQVLVLSLAVAMMLNDSYSVKNNLPAKFRAKFSKSLDVTSRHHCGVCTAS